MQNRNQLHNSLKRSSIVIVRKKLDVRRIRKQLVKSRIANIYIMLFLSIVLVVGYSITANNKLVYVYKCYSMAFFYRQKDLMHSPDYVVCKSIGISGFSDKALYRLPPEYPLLSLLPFSIPLIFPAFYDVGFNIEMLSVSLFIFLFLKRVKSAGSSWVYAFYVMTGGLSTALGRFDIIVGALLLLFVHCALSHKFQYAYIFLALAALLKLFPILFLVPLFIYEQSEIAEKETLFSRLRGISIFLTACFTVTLISVIINLQGTIGPIRYYLIRPFEAESFPASVLWLASKLKLVSVASGFQFGSLNIYAKSQEYSSLYPLQQNLGLAIAVFFSCLFLVFLGWIYIAMYKGRTTFSQTIVAIMLLTLCTGKVLSPQYLLWVIPIVAYMFGTRLKWLVAWSGVCVFTSLLYPIFWNGFFLESQTHSLFVPTLLIRNSLLLLVTVFYFLQHIIPSKIPDLSKRQYSSPNIP